MEQSRHSRGPAGQRVEVKVERHQLLLLFIIFAFSGPISTFVSYFLRFFFGLTL